MEDNGNLNYGPVIRDAFNDARLKKITKGQIIHYQGDAVTEILYLQKGYVKAYIILDSGETRTMFLLSENDIFPVSFSLAANWSGESIKYFYEAMSNVETRLLSPAELKRRTDNNPHLTTAILSYMAYANESVIELLESTKSKSATDKVEAALRYIVRKLSTDRRGSTYELGLRLSHQEIADLCGLTRETVSVALKSLEKNGQAKIKGSTITIKDAV
jgi:CRP/FNR family transcriptional regulator